VKAIEKGLRMRRIDRLVAVTLLSLAASPVEERQCRR
jgi:hypothetical protein